MGGDNIYKGNANNPGNNVGDGQEMTEKKKEVNKWYTHAPCFGSSALDL